jgi:general stress protein 26
MENEERSLHDLIHPGHVLMLVTQSPEGTMASRPLTVAEVDQEVVWFLVDGTAEWAQQLAAHPHVNAALADKGANHWASLTGRARLVEDPATTERLWSPLAGAYFSDEHDPRIAALRLTVDGGEYWTAPGFGVIGRLVAAVAAAAGRPAAAGDHGPVVTS